MTGFPIQRPRRLRRSEALRQMVRETVVDTGDLISGAFVCPGRGVRDEIAAMPRALDERGYTSTPILAYSAKYASGFYGPFREAADSAPQFGDRRGYQMDPANAREALREIALDVEEGADMIMVKPALAYLDIINRVRQEFSVTIAAYNVSGECSMIKTAV